MTDKNSEAGKLTVDDLEKVTGGNPIAPNGAAGNSRPKNQPDPSPEDMKLIARAGLFGFGNGAAGGATPA